VMDIHLIQRCLIFAFKKEAESFLAQFKRSVYTIYIGSYRGKPTMLLLTGCGLKAAGASVSYLLSSYEHLKELYNLGFAGSISGRYKVNDVVQVTEVFNEEGESVNTKLMLHNSLSIAKCISLQKPVEDQNTKNIIKEKYNADIVDMEAAAVCSAMEGFKCGLSIIKIISDLADSNFKQDIIRNSRSLSDKLESKFKQILEV